jgi:hypothetical protein
MHRLPAQRTVLSTTGLPGDSDFKTTAEELSAQASQPPPLFATL